MANSTQQVVDKRLTPSTNFIDLVMTTPQFSYLALMLGTYFSPCS
jgi:hypothetical protein